MIKEKITFPNQAAYEEFFKDYLPDIPCRYIVVIESLTAEDDTEVKNVVFISDNNNPQKKSEIYGASSVEAVFSQAEVIAEQEETIALQAAAIEDYQTENVVSKTEYDSLQDDLDDAVELTEEILLRSSEYPHDISMELDEEYKNSPLTIEIVEILDENPVIFLNGSFSSVDGKKAYTIYLNNEILENAFWWRDVCLIDNITVGDKIGIVSNYDVTENSPYINSISSNNCTYKIYGNMNSIGTPSYATKNVNICLNSLGGQNLLDVSNLYLTCCEASMFKDCTNIEISPIIPTPVSYLFKGCSSLNIVRAGFDIGEKLFESEINFLGWLSGVPEEGFYVIKNNGSSTINQVYGNIYTNIYQHNFIPEKWKLIIK